MVVVRSVRDDGQTKLVSYEGVRRVRLVMLQDEHAYPVSSPPAAQLPLSINLMMHDKDLLWPVQAAAAEYLDDDDTGRSTVSSSEREVYAALSEVLSLHMLLARALQQPCRLD